MAHTDTEIKDLKINFGTKAKIEENIDSMAIGELVFTTDNTLPDAPSANGEYNLKKDANGLSWVEDSGGEGTVTDVQFDGESIVDEDGVADIETEEPDEVEIEEVEEIELSIYDGEVE